MSRKRDDYFACKGGLDLVSSAIDVRPGMPDFARNWEVDRNGFGYVEHEGCERFDGRPLPSSLPAYSEALRAAIRPVPGAGPIRGVWVFESDVYAFRDSEDGASCRMYQATEYGWHLIETPRLQPGGDYEFCNYNFYAAADKRAMYGVDGVNPPFAFDGRTFRQIDCRVTDEAPNRIAAHQYHLFLGFRHGSVIHSPPGEPDGEYSPIQGAGELGMGDGITNLVPLRNDVMAVYGDSTIHLLYGSSAADFQLVTNAFDSGAFPRTVQPIWGHLMLSGLGVRSLQAVQAYGDFSARTESALAEDWLKPRLDQVVGSLVSRAKNHYRLYFHETDGTSELSASFVGKALQFMISVYPFTLTCFASGMIEGEEHLYAGAANGFVYRLDSGNSFDGQPLTTILRLPFNHEKTPNIRKYFRECVPELKGNAERVLQFSYELEFGDRTYPQGIVSDISAFPKGPYWGVSDWGEFVWGGSAKSPIPIKIPGSGSNIALIFSGTRNGEAPLALSGIRLYYELRRHI